MSAENGDESLLKTITTITDDVSGQKLYITGATGALYDGASPDGSTKHGAIKTVHQAYGRDYQLPNLTAYNESCATVGYVMWQWRMFELTGDAHYADLFERSLYNGVLPAISLEGKDYFYVNALKKLKDFEWPMCWSRTRTPNVKSSFCCPPNVVRTIAEAHNFVYSLSPDTLWVNLYGASTLDTAWTDGARVKLTQATDYPWDGAVKLTIAQAPMREITLKLRIPGWLRAGARALRVNGQPVASELKPGTYAEVKRHWKTGDAVALTLDLKPALWEANPLGEETTDQRAVRFGPLVYCLESNDLPAWFRLTDVALTLGETQRLFTPRREKIAGANVVTLTLPGFAMGRSPWATGPLYREATAPTLREFPLKLVPYFPWGNRGDTEMSVWLPGR